MKSKTTNRTFEEPAFSISSANVATPITGLTCIVTIDKNDCLAKAVQPCIE